MAEQVTFLGEGVPSSGAHRQWMQICSFRTPGPFHNRIHSLCNELTFVERILALETADADLFYVSQWFNVDARLTTSAGAVFNRNRRAGHVRFFSFNLSPMYSERLFCFCLDKNNPAFSVISSCCRQRYLIIFQIAVLPPLQSIGGNP